MPTEAKAGPANLAGKRIGLLTTSASRLGGGVFEAVAAQTGVLKRLGATPIIFALQDEFAAEDAARFKGAELFYLPVTGPRQIGFAPGLIQKLLTAELDCLHLHGIWQYPTRASRVWAARTGLPLIISPHGMMDPWITARGKFKKSLARLGYERAAWRSATAFHALTGSEHRDILAEAGAENCIVIPNAGPAPAVHLSASRQPEFLYLGRIHPKKNIAALIDAWCTAVAGETGLGARLTIAGWGDRADVAVLEDRLARAPASIRFVGPAFGPLKERLMGDARFFVLPSLSEGLPMAVLEAWAHGTPALLSSACNLPTGFQAGAALDCGVDAESIAESIRQALATTESDWLTMSAASRTLANDEFSSTKIGARWAEFYFAVIGPSANKGELR